ncbi:MAG TPA: nucleotidyl transferase AbiEii/AbiGii toxin family protein [Pyrinomonadaceae bacterium]|nr:nucleotidyl transferase AbiEii/AbiGii toxin family protein [Pyrinomonadaceae bacterium]
MREPLPLATIHDAVLEFLRGRDDVVVFGATAVNAYVDEPRMTQDIDLMSTRANELAEELRSHLSELFHIAVRIRVIGESKGFRLFQVQKSGNRHLVDIRPVESLPPSQKIEDIRVISPAELIAHKVISYNARRGKPKAGTDWRDMAVLLLTFPDLKTTSGPVSEALNALHANQEVMNAWRQLVAEEITSPEDDSEFN